MYVSRSVDVLGWKMEIFIKNNHDQKLRFIFIMYFVVVVVVIVSGGVIVESIRQLGVRSEPK